MNLTLPELRWPYYWRLEVSDSSVWVCLCRRPFLLFRNAICSKEMGLVSHRGEVTDALLREVEEKASELVALRRLALKKGAPAHVVAAGLRAAADPSVLVRVDR